MSVSPDLPKIGAPATRALSNIGVTSLAQLSKYSENNISDLHGMGPKALGILKRELKAKKLSFRK